MIPSGPITSYFVKHVNVPTPSLYSTVTVRLKRDDGAAVYVNGVEAVRDNLPGGPLTASTPASSLRLRRRREHLVRVPGARRAC